MLTDFSYRHIGPRKNQIQEMLTELGFSSLNELSNTIIPKDILLESPMNLPEPRNEPDTIDRLREIAKMNTVTRSFIGMGYYGTFTPGVIQRNILENPGWYTQYTPYQSEISQGRLEALLNFQTMITDLTALPISNASLLDEATAAAEAMMMFYNSTKNNSKNEFLISNHCHPQTIDVLKTRANPLKIKLKICNISLSDFNDNVFGAIVQYPDTNGLIKDFSDLCDTAHKHNSSICIATDLLSLAMIKPPGEMGADFRPLQ